MKKGKHGKRRKLLNGNSHKNARAYTLSIRGTDKAALARDRLLYPEAVYGRPLCRRDCKNVPRPCPYVGCKYHLYLDVNEDTGSIKLNHPGIEVWEMKVSCALDVAEYGGMTLDAVGKLMNLSRERIRQLECKMAEVILELDRENDSLLEWYYGKISQREGAPNSEVDFT
jgi:hypothetical protein